MDVYKKQFYYSLFIPVTLIVLMWAVKLIEVTWNLSFSDFGIFPRTVSGLKGILFSPLIHGDFAHLTANTLSFFVLSWAGFYFYREIGLQVFLLMWLITGTWVWFGAREAYHIGASGIIYGLASFLLVSGIIRKHPRLMAVAMAVVFMYGSLIWGIFPQFFPEQNISWEGHLSGLVAGVVLAIYYRNKGPQKPVYEWEEDDEDEEEEHIAEDDVSGKIEIRYHITREGSGE